MYSYALSVSVWNETMKTEYLPCFFLLATDGIWLISTNRWKSILPIVERIEHPPQVAYSIGIESRLRGLGNTIGLDTLGAQLCMQSRYSTGKTVTLKTLEESSSEDKGPRTGKMIACFLTLEDAQKALKKMKITDPLQRWQNETVEVLKAIGENHPVFIVTREGKFQFPLDFYEDANIRTNSCPVIDAALFNSFFDTPSVNADAATPESNPSKGFPKKYQRENPVADNSLRELIRERFEGSLPDIAALIAAGRITVAAPLAPHSQGSRIVRGPRGPYVRQLPVASPSPVSPVTAPVQATTKAAYVRIEGIVFSRLHLSEKSFSFVDRLQESLSRKV